VVINEANTSKGKCPACDTSVVALTKQNGRVVIIVKCRCMNHPDDVVVFDLATLLEGLEEKPEAAVYIHKGNSTLN
jgi:hypothetical protein